MGRPILNTSLKSFVERTLYEVSRGIEEANRSLGYEICPRLEGVNVAMEVKVFPWLLGAEHSGSEKDSLLLTTRVNWYSDGRIVNDGAVCAPESSVVKIELTLGGKAGDTGDRHGKA